MVYRILLLILSCVPFCSCIEKKSLSKEQRDVLQVVEKMTGQHILFPKGMNTNFKIDSLLKKESKLVVYLDSAECAECKLSLDEWYVKIREMKFVNKDVAFVFIINSSSDSLINSLLKKHRFDYPIFIDKSNSFFDLNSLGGDHRFQVFLLDKENNIMLVGDPIRNDRIWKLYKEKLNKKVAEGSSKRDGEVGVNIDNLFDFGEFDWRIPQCCTFTIQNGKKDLLIVQDITTSCGCTTVEYFKEPVPTGKSLDIKVTYKADHPEHFNKTITVYCNAEESPLQLKIQGNAK